MQSFFNTLVLYVLFSVVISKNINKTTEDEKIKAQFDAKLLDYKINDYKENEKSDYVYGDDYYEDYDYDSGNNTANSTTGKPKCRLCTMKTEQRRHRIETIKSKIQHALKLDTLGMPNTTGYRLPKVPSFLRLKQKYEHMEMQADSPSNRKREKMLYEEAQEEFGQPERTYTFATLPPDNLGHNFSNTIYFDLPLTPEKDAHKALLWVYINEESIYGRNMTEIYVYAIDPPGKSGGPPKKREIGRRKRHYMKGAGWHHFNIICQVKKWNEKSKLNMGIIVEALDESKNNLIVLPTEEESVDGYEPMLDIRTSLKKSKRAKRSTQLFCDDREEIQCCRYPLEIDFVEFGWDFVITPSKYAAYYCAGECEGESLGVNTHTHIVNQVPLPSREYPASAMSNAGPCCTPTHMSELTMLYYNHRGNIQYTRLPRMKVDRCGCA